MNCTLAVRMLDALVDDELDASTAGDMAAHLASCASCRELHSNRVAMRAALRSPELRYEAPSQLRRAVLRDLAAAERVPSSRGRVVRWWQALAMGGAMALAGAIGGWWVAQPGAFDTLPDVAVERHVAALTPQGPRVDVESSDRHTVKPWFQGRLEFAPMVRDLSAQGIELLGARVDRLGERQAVAVVYRMRGHIVDVFSWRAGRDRAPNVKATVRGFNVIAWRAGDLDYAVVSDADATELGRFTAAFRAQ